MTSFSSENFEGVHPLIMEALSKVNHGFATSYGQDDETGKAKRIFRRITGRKDLELFFCFNGSGANNFGISAVTEKYHAVYCTDLAHLYNAESTTTEAMSGCRLYGVRAVNGKIDLDHLRTHLEQVHAFHSPLPGVVSISQPTELGTVYSREEMQAIAGFCRHHELKLHIDGARIFNALVSLNCTFKELIAVSQPDVVTVGGTKAGLMYGEAVLIFRPERFDQLERLHKRSTQLASKARFIAAQFNAILQEQHWKPPAASGNNLAKYFATKLNALEKCTIAFPVETNTVFVKMDKALHEKLSKHAGYYRWSESAQLSRFTFSAGNTRDEIDRFFEAVKNADRK